MSHEKCVYVECECPLCAVEAPAECDRAVLSQRGRWMVARLALLDAGHSLDDREAIR